MNTTNWDFGDDLGAGKTDAATAADIRKNAHVANGGTQTFPCPKCNGTGMTRWGRCFKCNGNGSVSKGVIAAAKGKITKEANKIAWQNEHQAEVAYINARADRWDFMFSMRESLMEYGKLTDNQLAAVQRAMAKDAAKKVEWAEAKTAAAPVVPTEGIQALFDQAKVKLAKTAIFRTVDITISRAPATGRNAGALYVKTTAGNDYCGKIVDGKWYAKWGAPDVLAALQKVAADPTAEAIAYGLKFKACCCCGKTLRAPVSVAAVVGPVCAPKWGLDYLRLEAAEMLAAEVDEEN